MNIVYISHLTEKISEGPNYSVPAQIKAQKKYADIFWWNLTEAVQDHWTEVGCFHGIKEYSDKNFDSLPIPFNKPDLVVFESFYYLDDVKLARQCRKKSIKYVIVPRSALTKQGQKKKAYKKIPANILFFKPMTKGAALIQYLTQKEKEDSGEHWCRNSQIIPNGIQKREKPDKHYVAGGKKGIYIGRFDPYQKGLDLLIDVCTQMKSELLNHGIRIELYGPERNNCRADFKRIVKDRGIENILIVKEGVFGAEKEKVLKDADFFIMTSRFEGMPMSLIEALSYGLPALITEGTNMVSEIQNYNAGWGCENSVEDIKRAFIDLIHDDTKFTEMSINAWKLSCLYSWDIIAQKTNDIYLQVIK